MDTSLMASCSHWHGRSRWNNLKPLYRQGLPVRNHSPDVVLLDRLRRGDSQAWQDVAETFRQRLRNLAASALPAEVDCRADASDVVQQSFAEANESFTAFRGNSLPELFDWLATIVSNNVTDAIRQ